MNVEGESVTVTIGGLPIEVRAPDPDFIRMLRDRYASYVTAPAENAIRFDIELIAPTVSMLDDDLHVSWKSGLWIMRRGDFLAEWDPATKRGHVRQAAYPYAIDSVFRIVHSLVLARQGGFLLHSASAIRNGRAFLFSGVSGAGKTTISRLAPPDATLLTDEISYVLKQGDGYRACGTPFAGELARPGENVEGPIAALYLLAQGSRNIARPLAHADAARRLLRNILFFAQDEELVAEVLQSACDFVARVPVYELTFRPNQEVWNLVA